MYQVIKNLQEILTSQTMFEYHMKESFRDLWLESYLDWPCYIAPERSWIILFGRKFFITFGSNGKMKIENFDQDMRKSEERMEKVGYLKE